VRASARGIVFALGLQDARHMDAPDLGMSLNRAIVAALLELASADRTDWASTIQHILRVDGRALDVERVSYWRMREDPRAIICEMAYQRATGAFERGHVMPATDQPAYFAAISKGPVRITDSASDPRVATMREYLETRGIGALLDFPVWV